MWMKLFQMKRLLQQKNVTINEEFFSKDISLENPTMPGVLIIEALAQVGSIFNLKKMDQFEGETAYIGGINKAKFRQKKWSLVMS